MCIVDPRISIASICDRVHYMIILNTMEAESRSEGRLWPREFVGGFLLLLLFVCFLAFEVMRCVLGKMM